MTSRRNTIQKDLVRNRLLLGTDAVAFADQEMKVRAEEYAKWKEFSCRSDY